MMIKVKCISKGNTKTTENFTVHLTNPMLYDRLHTLSVEYSTSIEKLTNVAIKRLIDDIAFVRNLRIGRIKLE